VPVDPAEPVVTAACFFCCRRAMGEAITRHSLRPLPSEGDGFTQNPGGSCRGNAVVCVSRCRRPPAEAGDPVSQRRRCSSRQVTAYWMPRMRGA
jgi:hypothetical protein